MAVEYPVSVSIDDYVQCLQKVGRTAPVAPTEGQTVNTLRLPELTFTYLDCGRWGGTIGTPRRDFGIVWGKWAALCEFRAQPGAPQAVDPDPNSPLNAALKALCGPHSSVQVVDFAWSRSHVEPDWSRVYVLLPDFHLPVVRGFPEFHPTLPGPGFYAPAGPCMGRDSWPILGFGGYLESGTDEEGAFNDVYGERILCDTALEWYQHAEKNDIFQGADADLILFLEQLDRYGGQAPIHLVHLGDMYELWNGLDRYFDRNGNQQVALRWNPPATNRDRQGHSAPEFIDYWVQRANAEFAGVIAAFDSLSAGHKSYIWGNHDNYLAAYTPSGIAPRIREIRSGGIYVEHGHRGDGYNCDGAITGHFIANRNFGSDNFWRAFDPDRRDCFVQTAADSFVASPDFCIYVMGHTHQRFLAQVAVQFHL